MWTPFLQAAFFSAVSAWLILLAVRWYRHRIWFRDLPGPPHSFLWGHLKTMGLISAKFPLNSHPQAYLTQMARDYNLPGIFYVDLWPVAESMVVLTDVELMNYVHVLKPLAQHPQADAFLAPVLGHDVVAVANGATWKMLHSAMAPSFAPGHVKTLSAVFVEECMHFRKTLIRLAASGAAFDMEEKGAELIFDVIARVVINLQLHAQTKGSQLLEDLREMIKLTEAGLSMNPLDKVKAWWRRRTLLDRLHAELLKLIRERFELLRSEKLIPNRMNPYSTLDLMLREQLIQNVDSKDMAGLDPEYERLLLSNIKGLLVGGHGTTNDTLCYCYMLLSKNPEVLKTLRDEHSRVFDPDLDKTLEMVKEYPHKLNELTYTTAVIKETLRLFPVGFGVRIAQPGAKIQYKGQSYPIDNSISVVALAHALHYDESTFPEPTKFIPERFVDPDTVPRAAFRTFSRGPRACAGQNLAIDELRVILVATIREFEFEYVGGKPNKEPRASYTDLDTVYGEVIFQELGIEAKPRGGMKMRVKRISGLNE